MTSSGPGPQRGWKPGDVANGHILGPDNVWRPLPPRQAQWRQGDVYNGHVLGPDNVWRPVQHGAPQRRPWHRRPWGVAGIVVGSLFIFGVGNAMAGGGDPGDDSSRGETSGVLAKDTEASDEPTAAGDEAATEAEVAAEDEATTPKTKPEPKPKPKPKPKAKPKPKPKPKPRTYLVTSVTDGDTIDLGNGQTVRLVGIDTPERGECGYERASDNLARLVLGKQVRLAVSDEDTDQYGRLLRYVDVGSTDAGLSQIKQGFAIARYDSRDGYGFHPREPIYLKVDGASKQYHCPKPKPQPLVGGGGGDSCMTGYSPCLPVVGDLDCGDVNGPVRVTGSDPYRLDADGDGIGCDS